MTHIEVIVVPDDPADDRGDAGLTPDAAGRLVSALRAAGFHLANGTVPTVRPPATVRGGWRGEHERKL